MPSAWLKWKKWSLGFESKVNATGSHRLGQVLVSNLWFTMIYMYDYLSSTIFSIRIYNVNFIRMTILHIIYIESNWLELYVVYNHKYHYKHDYLFEGSLEVNLPTIWQMEKQRWEESEKRREEERRSEKRKSQKKAIGRILTLTFVGIAWRVTAWNPTTTGCGSPVILSRTSP